jgi:hypothetical protein
MGMKGKVSLDSCHEDIVDMKIELTAFIMLALGGGKWLVVLTHWYALNRWQDLNLGPTEYKAGGNWINSLAFCHVMQTISVKSLTCLVIAKI